MTRILASVVLVVSLCAGRISGVNPGSISGYVKNTGGMPQMGATVQLVSAAGQLLVVHTDVKGYFAATGLVPGSYDVHVSAPSFLPTLREDVVLAAGATKVLNITLNTLFEAVGMLPPLKKDDDENDSWKWTLRKTANRPVLRFDGDTRADRRIAAGRPAAQGQPGPHGRRRQRRLRQRLRSGHRLQYRAVAFPHRHPGILPATSVWRRYARRRAARLLRSQRRRWLEPVVALMVRRFAAPDVPHGGALQAISMSYADGFSVGD